MGMLTDHPGTACIPTTLPVLGCSIEIGSVGWIYYSPDSDENHKKDGDNGELSWGPVAYIHRSSDSGLQQHMHCISDLPENEPNICDGQWLA